MVPRIFDEPTNRMLRQALTGLQLRQQTIANNIANADTPNYRAQKVDFEQALAAELAGPPKETVEVVRLGLHTTHERHLEIAPTVRRTGVQPAISDSLDGTLRNDGNTVDVEREMTKLAETQILYNALGQITSGKLNKLRTAINEGRR